jgi:hypothetical protein
LLHEELRGWCVRIGDSLTTDVFCQLSRRLCAGSSIGEHVNQFSLCVPNAKPTPNRTGRHHVKFITGERTESLLSRLKVTRSRQPWLKIR